LAKGRGNGMTGLGRALRDRGVWKKILITLGLIAAYRAGSVLPIPGVDYWAVNQCISAGTSSDAYTLVNLISGGALLQLSVFALGVMPFITAMIVMQLLPSVIPALDRIKKEGPSGQARILQYSRYLTVGIAALQALALVSLARVPGAIFPTCTSEIVPNRSTWILLVGALVVTLGALLVMWIGELIAIHGVAKSGISLLVFVGIVSVLPDTISGVYATNGLAATAAVVGVALVLLIFVVWIEAAQRRIPIQYSSSSALRTSSEMDTYLPLPINAASVIPVIFSSSLLFFPVFLAQLVGDPDNAVAVWILQDFSDRNGLWHIIVLAVMIIFFAFFYVSVTYNPLEMADDIRDAGGFVPGIRSGAETAAYLRYVLIRLTTVGSIYLASVAIIPGAVAADALGVGTQLAFLGTSMLIISRVGLDSVREVASMGDQYSYSRLFGGGKDLFASSGASGRDG